MLKKSEMTIVTICLNFLIKLTYNLNLEMIKCLNLRNFHRSETVNYLNLFIKLTKELNLEKSNPGTSCVLI